MLKIEGLFKERLNIEGLLSPVTISLTSVDFLDAADSSAGENVKI